jgi:hypothetical protein
MPTQLMRFSPQSIRWLARSDEIIRTLVRLNNALRVGRRCLSSDRSDCCTTLNLHHIQVDLSPLSIGRPATMFSWFILYLLLHEKIGLILRLTIFYMTCESDTELNGSN